MSKSEDRGRIEESTIRPTGSMVAVNETHENTAQDVITITSDRAELILLKNKDRLMRGSLWHTPLALFIALTTTLCTADFKDKGLTASVWEAIFVIGVIGSLIFTLVFSTKALKNHFRLRGKKIEKIDSVEEILKCLKEKQ